MGGWVGKSLLNFNSGLWAALSLTIGWVIKGFYSDYSARQEQPGRSICEDIKYFEGPCVIFTL